MKFRLVEEINKLIAYNGSLDYFTKFSETSKGETIGTENFDIPGVYFSSSKEFAKSYACGESSGSYTDENGQEHTYHRKQDKGYLYTCELNYNKPIIIDYRRQYMDMDSEPDELRGKIAKNVNKYKSQGYDIVILKNIRYEGTPDENGNPFVATEYVVLDYKIITILDMEEVSSEI